VWRFCDGNVCDNTEILHVRIGVLVAYLPHFRDSLDPHCTNHSQSFLGESDYDPDSKENGRSEVVMPEAGSWGYLSSLL
jgi:hypothetical protein